MNGKGVFSYTVIEGIGCLQGFTFPFYPNIGLSVSRLECFSNNGISPKVSPPVEFYFDNVTSCKNSVSHIEHIQHISISPHPANAASNITLPYIFTDGSIVIFNTMGQVVTEQVVQNQSKISVGSLKLNTGLYYYNITDARSGQTWQGKLVYR